MADSLLAGYDGLVCDLDGVVYAGPSAIPHAVDALASARAAGRSIVYATNNASRPPRDVAAHLRELGLDVAVGDVVNSSMAAAHLLDARIPKAASVLAVGGPGVSEALADAGYEPVRPSEARGRELSAVVQGYGPDVRAAELAEAAYAIQSGAHWVATNTDLTLPTDRGVAPGNGSLVGAVRAAVTVAPEVAGKPMPVMYDMAAQRIGVQPARVLAIGDRLETDIEGAVRGGYDSALVLTGVHGWGDAASAPALRRPTYVLADLRGLDEPYEVTPWDESSDHEADRARGSALPVLRGLLTRLWHEVDAGRMTVDEARARMEGAGEQHE